jgi:RimJ/RimL family protein N-acetyltransferase
VNGPVLGTERLILTPVALDDFDDLVALWRDETFVRHITGRALSPEEVWFRLLRDLGHWSALGHGNWSMRLKTDGTYVGGVGILDYRRTLRPAFDTPEVGWGLASAFHGRGLAGEGLAAALGWADNTLGADRTVCMITPGNQASLRLAARAGFVPWADALYQDAPVTLMERHRPAPAALV